MVEHLRVFCCAGFFRFFQGYDTRMIERQTLRKQRWLGASPLNRGRIRIGDTMEPADDKNPEDEEWLEIQIRARLGSRVREFRVVYQNDGVILRGVAFTYYAKQLAQHSVMEITDLPILANEIEVR